MSEPRNIVLVGHCGPDMFMLKNAVSRVVPEARIESIDDEDTLETHLETHLDAGLDAGLEAATVLLVNRVLDGRFVSASGIDLIRRVTARDPAPVALLISNHADAQEEAVAAGARPGFGKGELFDPRTAERIREAVERDAG